MSAVHGVVRGHLVTSVGVSRSRIAEPWTLNALAHEVNLSRSQLVRSFDAIEARVIELPGVAVEDLAVATQALPGSQGKRPGAPLPWVPRGTVSRAATGEHAAGCLRWAERYLPTGVQRSAVRQVGARLMDAVDPTLVDQATAAVTSVAGISGVRELRIRWIGHTPRAEVDAGLTVTQAHDLAHHAETHLLASAA